ncbi:glutathione transferase GstA [Mangrovibacter yixingensis]|uniref:glutathione transferase GstA n=1 Tax=Mangrovibacter yixingensis TaxID=1529639 RepID=UPI001CF9AA34|nr:glutathione transferase GstA [Mangrovibacter yixingensis]
MKLFYKAGACSLSPHIVLRESGLDFTLSRVDLQDKTTESGEDFWSINPTGQVPALLLDNETLLTEGAVIVQYIADQVPDRQLLPPVGTLSRYQALSWLNFIATELHKGFTPLFSAETPESWKASCTSKLLKKMSLVNDALSNKHWLMGQRFSVADAYLFTVLNWGYALSLDMSQFEHINAFMERMHARPAVMAALKAEGLK